VGSGRQGAPARGLPPWLADDARAATETGSIGAPVESLDLATVVDVSRAVSSELVLDKLLQTLAAHRHPAGRVQGAACSSSVDGGQQRIEAEALVDGDAVHVQLLDATGGPMRCCPKRC
jgi:hypothetical protein